jgi:hypothetical protein
MVNETQMDIITYFHRIASFLFLRCERRAEVVFFRPPFLVSPSLAFAIIRCELII